MDTQVGCTTCGVALAEKTFQVINGQNYCVKCAETVKGDTLVPNLSTAHQCLVCGRSLIDHRCPHCSASSPLAFRESTSASRKNLELLLEQIAAQSHFEERYHIVRELARGGMGIVWHAYDLVLRRDVAIKMMIGDMQQVDLSLRGQFLKEARVGGRLLHPNLLSVFDLGVNREGQIYYTMRLVDGDSLQHCLEAVQKGVHTQMVEFPLRKIVEAMAKACEGIDYAHQNGVIHLDVKPHNILVSGFSEVFVIDWGLARVDDVDDTQELIDLYRQDDSGQLTSSATMAVGTGIGGGRVVGTPSYMSPEQARGAVHEFGPATDIYGLGGILHAVLYDIAPNLGSTVPEMLEATEQPKQRQTLRDGILPRRRRVQPREKESISELEAICLRSLAVQPEHRHADAAELAHDLREWLSRTSNVWPA